MESGQLEHRIILTQRIMDVWRTSGNDRSLADIIADYTFGMTREELEEFLKGSIVPRLEEAWRDLKESKVRESNLREEAELERERRKRAERECSDKQRTIDSRNKEIESKDKEIEKLKKDLEDAKNSNTTAVTDKYKGTSRKSSRAVDKNFNKKDRQQGQDDYDGTNAEDVSSGTETSDAGDQRDVEMSKEEADAINSNLGKKYNLGDADEILEYACDLSQVPEDEIQVGKLKWTTVYDIKTVVTGRRMQFVKTKKKVCFIDEDGNEAWKWEYRNMHYPFKKKTQASGAVDADTEVPASLETEPFSRGNVPNLIEGTHSTPDTCGRLVMDFLVGYIPVNRIANMMRDYGLRLCRGTYQNWFFKYADHMRGAYEVLKNRVLCDGAVIFCDETWFRLHLRDAKDRKVYEWILANKKEKAVLYYYDDGSRGRKVIAELLEGRNVKAIHTDGYNAYFFLEGLGIIHIGCAAHVWRYIMDWFNATQSEDARLLLIDMSALYQVEESIRGKSPEVILATRNSDETTAILTRFKARLDVLNAKIDTLPKIGAKAVNYAMTMYPKIERWREDADFDIDNNFAEQAARPVAQLRKSMMFHASDEGAGAVCILRSFVETCKRCGVSVLRYFTEFFRGVVAGRTDYANMMPWNLIPATVKIN